MSTTTPEPLDPSFQISLPSFEGPLDLLLHLIRKHELDILDLPIAFVTERYLAYVSMMEQLDLDSASEYLVMAATLAHIKSKMLLPQEPEDQPDEESSEEDVDPRAELIRRLLEYQKYKNAAEQLGSRGIAGRDVFLRGSDAPEASGPPPLAPTSLFKLLDAFQAVLKRAKAEVAFEITSEGVSIQDRMRELIELLRERREVTFEMLFDGKVTIYDLVITFMALLEMAKRRLVRIYQADPHSPIHLRSTVLGEDGEAPPSMGGEWGDDAAKTTEPAAPAGPELELPLDAPTTEPEAPTIEPGDGDEERVEAEAGWEAEESLEAEAGWEAGWEAEESLDAGASWGAEEGWEGEESIETEAARRPRRPRIEWDVGIEPEQSVAPEPSTEAEASVHPEPSPELEPSVHPEPSTELEPSVHPEPSSEPEPSVIAPEPSIELAMQPAREPDVPAATWAPELAPLESWTTMAPKGEPVGPIVEPAAGPTPPWLAPASAAWEPEESAAELPPHRPAWLADLERGAVSWEGVSWGAAPSDAPPPEGSPDAEREAPEAEQTGPERSDEDEDA